MEDYSRYWDQYEATKKARKAASAAYFEAWRLIVSAGLPMSLLKKGERP